MKAITAAVSLALMGALALVQKPADRGPASSQATKLPLALGAIHPRLSPDGSSIAVSYLGAIWTVPASGGTLSRLTSGTGFDHEPAWSPDGAKIAFVRGANQLGGELKLINAADGKELPLPRPITVRGTVNFHKLDFDPTGSRLLGVFRESGKDHGLAWLNIQSGEVQSLGIDLSIWGRHALSADGQSIAYTATRDKQGEQSGNNGPETDVWKLPAAGGEPERIVTFPSHVHDLCWEADGRSMVLVSEVGGAHYNLWHLSLADPLRSMRQWTFGQADEDRPSVSKAGKLLYLDNRTGPTEIVLREIGSGREQAVSIDRLDFRAPVGRLDLKMIDRESGKPVVARVSLQQQDGKFTAPPGALYRMLRGMPHFYCDEQADWELPAGKYQLRVFRGPEYEPINRSIEIKPGESAAIAPELVRWTNQAGSGWYSGENHIHANYGYGQWYNSPETMLAQCAGEDLKVCNFMVANSDTDGVFDRSYFRGAPDPRSTRDTILYWNQEFRSTLWGHMTLVNLKQVVEPVFTGFERTTNPWDTPTNSDVADRAHWQKGHVNYTHPIQNAAKPLETPYSAKALPVDVALGKIDSIDLNNTYQETIQVWYRLLNCGFRLPPSAGTDCFLNRVFSQLPGGDRLYVQVDGAFSYNSWIEGLKRGRSFISNGPMLEFELDGRRLGDAIELGAPRRLKAKVRVRSFFPLAKAELIYNGNVSAEFALDEPKRNASAEQEIAVDRTGWLALRCNGPGHPDSPQPVLYAHSAPIYVTVAGTSNSAADDARFFLAWIDELTIRMRTRNRIPTDELRKQVEDQLESARSVYARIAASPQKQD